MRARQTAVTSTSQTTILTDIEKTPRQTRPAGRYTGHPARRHGAVIPNLRRAITVLALSCLGSAAVQAWELYSTNRDDNCAACHGRYLTATPYVSRADGQPWGGSLHNVHRNSPTHATVPGMLSSNCNACHIGASRFPVYLDASNGGNGLAPLSCGGCHSRAEDDRGLPLQGAGAGLRQHHYNAGQTICVDCHADSNPANYTTVGENVLPPYYFTPDAAHPGKPTDPCNRNLKEHYGGTTRGLDNDGDDVYDTADPDCFPPADINITPTTLNFGTVAQGNTVTREVTIQNLGQQSLTLTDISIAQTPGLDFVLGAAPSVPYVVLPGGSVDVSVDYVPSDVGADSGTLDVASDDLDEPLVSVPMAGSGVDAAERCDLEVAPLSLDFGTRELGTPTTLTTTLRNNSAEDCVVNFLTVVGADFALGAGAPLPPFTVALGSPVPVPVVYTPSDVSSDVGSLDIDSTDATEPVVNVALAGAGVEVRDIDVVPAAVDFGPVDFGASVTRTVTIQNIGGAALTVTDLRLTGTLEFDFSIGAPAVPFTIPGGTSVDVDLDYTPADIGPDSGSLEIASSDPDEPLVVVPLSGAGEVPVLQCDISVKPALNYGNVPVGGSRRRVVIIGNTGAGPCTIRALQLAGNPDFSVPLFAPRPPFKVNPGNTGIGVAVDYRPLEAGPDTATFTITSNDLDETQVVVTLSGTGIIEPEIDVTPMNADFGAVQTGMTATRAVTIRNVGNGGLAVSALNVTGSPDFALAAGAPAAPLVVPAGGSVSVAVEYTPTGGGSDSGALVIESADADEPVVTVGLSGAEIAPLLAQDIDVDPLALGYGQVELGLSTTRSVTVRNTGENDLIVTGLALTGSPDFRLRAGSPVPPFAVTSGSSVTVTIVYAPAEPAADSGTLRITSDDPDEPLVTASLSGEGIPRVPVCNIKLSRSAIAFGTIQAGQSRSARVLLTNSGDAVCVVSSFTLAGSADFRLAPNAPVPPVSVNPNRSTAIGVSIVYQPSDAGPDSGFLSVNSNDPDEPGAAVQLSGTGFLAPEIDVAPAGLAFGERESGTTSTLKTTIRNLGNGELTVSAVTLSGSADFAVAGGPLLVPFMVAPATSRDISIAYTPTGLDSDAGMLTIASNDADEPLVAVPLSGSEIPPQGDQDIDVSPVSIDAGAREIGTMATAVVTVRNLGERDLVVSGLHVGGSPDFGLDGATPTPPFTVSGGGSRDVIVRYRPSATGAAAATLEITSDDPDEPVVSVPLAGTGVPNPLVCDIRLVRSATVDFGSVAPPGGALKWILIANRGTADCTVDSLSITGSTDFQLGPVVPAVPFTMAPSKSAAVGLQVRYTPSDLGADSATLAIGSNDPDQPTLTVLLTGRTPAP